MNDTIPQVPVKEPLEEGTVAKLSQRPNVQKLVATYRSVLRYMYLLLFIGSGILLFNEQLLIGFTLTFLPWDYIGYKSLQIQLVNLVIFLTSFLFLVYDQGLLSRWKELGRRQQSEEMILLARERAQISSRLIQQAGSDIFDMVNLNLNHLDRYYAVANDQSVRSFAVSVASIIVGLAVLVLGVLIFYFQDEPNITMTALSSASGLLLEFIGASYFYLHRKTNEQLNLTATNLTRLQDYMLCLKVADGFKPRDKRMKLKERIVLSILSEHSTDGVSETVFEAPQGEET